MANIPSMRFAQFQVDAMNSLQPWVQTFERENELIYKQCTSMKSEYYTDGIALIIKDRMWACLTLVRWPEPETEEIAKKHLEG